MFFGYVMLFVCVTLFVYVMLFVCVMLFIYITSWVYIKFFYLKDVPKIIRLKGGFPYFFNFGMGIFTSFLVIGFKYLLCGFFLIFSLRRK